ncbi:hypothetical protein XELAEV_18001659mg [Xenopus laevis]|uniref:Uncharacterized protein n=1 Tax=Xenopus laevis TaxID=8355 RepID=A0A974GZ96_XENLA|nr:hypothetical protein XELAEV_18001659mg [Xenopus laevis]
MYLGKPVPVLGNQWAPRLRAEPCGANWVNWKHGAGQLSMMMVTFCLEAITSQPAKQPATLEAIEVTQLNHTTRNKISTLRMKKIS